MGEGKSSNCRPRARRVDSTGLAKTRLGFFRVGSRIIEGRFDGLAHGLARGWAWKPADPKLRLRLQLHIDGKFACEGRADQPRADLVAAGKGDGGYAYAFAIPERFFDGRGHRVAVVDVDTGVTLPGALRSAVLTAPDRSVVAPQAPMPQSAPLEPAPAPTPVEEKVKVNAKAQREPAPAPPLSSAGGVLEGFKWGRLRGSASDPQAADRQALVEIKVDGLPEAIVRVDPPEEGAGGAGVFAWKPGQHLVDGKTHEVRARVLGEEAELEGSPAIVDFSPPPPVLKCHLAPIKGGKVWGWAWDKADPEARQEVQILIDGLPVGSLVADEFNEGLARKGMGDAHHGFAWSIDRRYADGREHQVSALVRGVEISGSPAPFVLEIGVATERSAHAATTSSRGAMEPKARSGGLKGSLDAVTDLQISGWAFDKAKPDARLKVEIAIDGKAHALIPADQFRRSLKERGLQDIRHGFVWTMDRRLADGRPHRLTVQVDGEDLTGSPVIFTLPKARPAGLPPLSVSHLPTPVDARAAFLSATVLSLRREVLRERQELMAELAVLARVTAEAEAHLSQTSSDPELEALVKDMTAAVQSLGLKLSRG